MSREERLERLGLSDLDAPALAAELAQRVSRRQQLEAQAEKARQGRSKTVEKAKTVEKRARR